MESDTADQVRSKRKTRMSAVVERAQIRQVQISPAKSVIEQTCQWLVTNFSSGNQLNLDRYVIGLPTSRACRRLLESLVQATATKQLIFAPPTITTVGRVPEFLYEKKYPLASDLMQRLAWTNAVTELDDQEIRHIGQSSATELTWADRFSVAALVQELHKELAGNMLSFRDVLEKASEFEQFAEHERWTVLHKLQMAYFKNMRESGVWDLQTARRFAAAQQECSTDKQVVLVGTVDLNETMRRMIQLVADQVTLLVVADEHTIDGFDKSGCLNTSFWNEHDLDIPKDLLRFADRPLDQAVVAVDFLARLNGRYAPAEITIAVPDESIIPTVSRALRTAGVPTHDSTGETINASGPIRLLRLVAHWLGNERFSDLANLVRHEAVFDKISEELGTTTWLNQLDETNNRRCPSRIELFPRNSDKLLDQLVSVLSNLIGHSSSLRKRKQLDQWAVEWRELVQRFYGDVTVDRNDPGSKQVLHSLKFLNQVFSDTESLSSHWNITCSAEESLLAILTFVAERLVVADRDPDAVELIGWLDLTWDDAPVAVVTSFNEGQIPSSRNFHPFLPNSLRSWLGLLDNRMRFARDKYAMSMLLQNRKRLLLVAGRRDEFENPLLPSRLAFGQDAQANSQRLLQMIHHVESQNRKAKREFPQSQQFEIPQVMEIEAPPTISATEFDDYLNCPYRYYLKRILKLRSVDDRVEEMDPRGIGTLAHEVLERFGKSAVRDSISVKEIRDFFRQELHALFAKRFGAQPLPSIQIQVAQLEMRLERFAEVQVVHRRQGWRIEHTELADLQKDFVVDGKPISVTGRIDRVDRNEHNGLQAIIDYKTGSSATSHQFVRGQWKSLQLPLYKWMFTGNEHDSGEPVETGFGRLSRSLESIAIDLKQWDEEQIDLAVEQAADVIRAIRKNEFAPNPKRRWPDEFDTICQNQVFEKWVHPDAEDLR